MYANDEKQLVKDELEVHRQHFMKNIHYINYVII